MSAIDSLLRGLIDYAGLYPPAALDMPSAVHNYLNYSRGESSPALGRFVVDLNRLSELREVAGDSIRELRLSVIASSTSQWTALARLLDKGLLVESVEIKAGDLEEVRHIAKQIPAGIITYFELPFSSVAPETFDVIAATGARAKLRTGGVSAEAFPASEAIISILKILADRGIPWKATAGLHHPIRGCHPFTYAPDSPTGTMHGFVNLFLAAASLYFGGTPVEAKQLLEEESAESFSVSSDTIAWKSFCPSAEQLRRVREEFAIGFGSCSFEEPIHDLEALGWLK